MASSGRTAPPPRAVDEGDALMIDCGSTTTLFANALAARNLHLTVVTNCLPAARILGTSAHCRVILCPGDYVMREGGVYGPDTLAFIQRFKANKAFIGAGGVTPDGITDADSLSCPVKRAMMERSDRSVLLVDGSKFDVVQFERVCALTDVDDIVTDAAPPKRLSASLERQRDVIVAPGTEAPAPEGWRAGNGARPGLPLYNVPRNPVEILYGTCRSLRSASAPARRFTARCGLPAVMSHIHRRAASCSLQELRPAAACRRCRMLTGRRRWAVIPGRTTPVCARAVNCAFMSLRNIPLRRLVTPTCRRLGSSGIS
jgi:hypothetical protein